MSIKLIFLGLKLRECRPSTVADADSGLPRCDVAFLGPLPLLRGLFSLFWRLTLLPLIWGTGDERGVRGVRELVGLELGQNLRHQLVTLLSYGY